MFPSNDPTHAFQHWKYTGSDVPPPGDENFRINLWLFNAGSPSNNEEVEVVLGSFKFAKNQNP